MNNVEFRKGECFIPQVSSEVMVRARNKGLIVVCVPTEIRVEDQDLLGYIFLIPESKDKLVLGEYTYIPMYVYHDQVGNIHLGIPIAKGHDELAYEVKKLVEEIFPNCRVTTFVD